MAKVTRIDRAGTFYTTFVFEKSPDPNGGIESQELSIPANEADAFQTKVKNATWGQINTIYQRDGTTVIKTT